MIYVATVITDNNRFSKTFPTIHEAGEWLDQYAIDNNNTTMIETYNEAGYKTDGFIYSEKSK